MIPAAMLGSTRRAYQLKSQIPSLGTLRTPCAMGLVPDPEKMEFQSPSDVFTFAENMLELEDIIDDVEELEWDSYLDGWTFMSAAEIVVKAFGEANAGERVTDDELLTDLFSEAVTNEVQNNRKRYHGFTAEDLIAHYAPKYFLNDTGHFEKDPDVVAVYGWSSFF